jgi:hypothetical protein
LRSTIVQYIISLQWRIVTLGGTIIAQYNSTMYNKATVEDCNVGRYNIVRLVAPGTCTMKLTTCGIIVTMMATTAEKFTCTSKFNNNFFVTKKTIDEAHASRQISNIDIEVKGRL